MRKLLHNFCICQHSLNCVETMWTTKLFSPLWLLNVNLQTHPTRENFCTMFASVCNISIAVTFKLSCPSPHPRWLSCQPTCASPENLSLKTFKFIKSKSKILGGGKCSDGMCSKIWGGKCYKNRGGKCIKKGGGKCSDGMWIITEIVNKLLLLGKKLTFYYFRLTYIHTN